MTSENASQTGPGFSVLDGAAVVAGAAVASVHVRAVIHEELTIAAWSIILLAFFWIALTASGPMLLIVRGWFRRSPNYPRIGDVLWGVLGAPWVLTAPLESPVIGTGPTHVPLVVGLVVGLGVACMTALGVVWSKWVIVTREEAHSAFGPPWTNRVGLILAITWPLQCAVALVILG